ncbi:hypothetical protein [Candidatus Rariloculus sp.]|uniref:hypothetical protein n=1 Tax=Candidatus Rariloculus sp. TaxID=3101265 RepID=UPI003D10F4D3
MTIASLAALTMAADASAQYPPSYAPDPYWPQHLPNQWILGLVSDVAGIAAHVRPNEIFVANLHPEGIEVHDRKRHCEIP